MTSINNLADSFSSSTKYEAKYKLYNQENNLHVKFLKYNKG